MWPLEPVARGLRAYKIFRPPFFRLLVSVFLAAILLQYGSNFILTQRYSMSRIYSVMLLVGQEASNSSRQVLQGGADDRIRHGSTRQKHFIARYLHKNKFIPNTFHSSAAATNDDGKRNRFLSSKKLHSIGSDDERAFPVRDGDPYGEIISQDNKVHLPTLEDGRTHHNEQEEQEGLQEDSTHGVSKAVINTARRFTPNSVNSLPPPVGHRRKTLRAGLMAPVWELIDRIRHGLIPPSVATTPLPLPPCPKRPPGLQGTVSVILSAPDWPTLIKSHPEVSPGGRWRPDNCTARHKVAVIIPFRDRDAHLRIFLQHMHPFLQKQLIDYGIYVIEQAMGSQFNRAMLMNIGFTEAGKLYGYECYIFHDVDLLPEVDYNMYTCPHLPRHMSAAVDTFGYRLPYANLFGGVTALRTEHFKAVNGFSNFFFGWGGEDDDLYNRIKHRGLDITRYPLHVARYRMMNHKKENPSDDRFRMLNTGPLRYKTDGLNSLNYSLLAVKEHRLHTLVRVQLDKSQVAAFTRHYASHPKRAANTPDFDVHIPRHARKDNSDAPGGSAKVKSADLERTLLNELDGNGFIRKKRDAESVGVIKTQPRSAAAGRGPIPQTGMATDKVSPGSVPYHKVFRTKRGQA